MNTFSTEYMSSVPTGITSNVVKSLPRSVEIPISKPTASKNKLKKINELKTSLLKLAELIGKID